jgi:hypothetical protein
MRMAKLAVTLSLPLACRSSAPRTGPTPATVVPVATTITMPAHVGRYSLGETRVFDDPSQGTVYRYSAGDRTRISVFVYPISADIRVGDDPQAWVTKEGEKFAATFPIGVQRGWYEDFKAAYAGAAPLDTAGKKIPGFSAAVAARERGEVVIEMEYLYLVRGQLLKVRASVPGDAWEQTDVPVLAKTLAAMFTLP